MAAAVAVAVVVVDRSFVEVGAAVLSVAQLRCGVVMLEALQN